ncbi:NUDIX domain-containing protein [Andreprevotia chitinilytica]|uniref:NUDIX domain-containing protein n=1 Tax=Andreprevotia chitinilytica TaxID=396808 RepID=UPI00068F3E30|nr:NUDIX domain-containing protein [Andreprevotia chitinilytica]
MAISDYVKNLRIHVGNDLLLLPGVAAVIHNAAGEVLIQRRTMGDWSLPGGGIDPNETPAQAMVREVWEETGLHVRPTRVLGVFGGPNFRRVHPSGDVVEYLVVLFACDVIGGELGGQDDETESLHWMALDVLPEQVTRDLSREVFEVGYAGVGFN